MNQKRLFLLLGALVLGWAANAQSTGNNPTSDTTHITHHRFHRAPNGYGLHREFIHYSPEQRQQVMAINKEYRQKSADLFKQDNITLKQYKTGLLSLDKEKKAKLHALLTTQQKDQLAARHTTMDENHQVMAAAHLERLRLELNLTDDQVSQIKAGQLNLRNQAQAIHDNDNLLPQEKREEMRALMMTRNDNFKTILTPGQYTKFKQLSHHRFDGHWPGRSGFGGRTT